MRRSRKPLLGIFLNRGFESLPLRLFCSPVMDIRGGAPSHRSNPRLHRGYSTSAARYQGPSAHHSVKPSYARLEQHRRRRRPAPSPELLSHLAGFRIPPSPPHTPPGLGSARRSSQPPLNPRLHRGFSTSAARHQGPCAYHSVKASLARLEQHRRRRRPEPTLKPQSH